MEIGSDEEEFEHKVLSGKMRELKGELCEFANKFDKKIASAKVISHEFLRDLFENDIYPNALKKFLGFNRDFDRDIRSIYSGDENRQKRK